MASEIYKKRSYTKWAMEQENATGPVLKFQKYVLGRRGASSSPEPPETRGASPYSHAPPATPDVVLPSPAPSGADPILHRKLDRLDRKVDALIELIQCFLAVSLAIAYLPKSASLHGPSSRMGGRVKDRDARPWPLVACGRPH